MAALNSIRSVKETLTIVTQALSAGKSALGNLDYAGSIKLCREGIAMLGNEFYRPDTLEHTGERIVLADMQERSGQLEVAAKLLINVLEARLNLFATKWRNPECQLPRES